MLLFRNLFLGKVRSVKISYLDSLGISTYTVQRNIFFFFFFFDVLVDVPGLEIKPIPQQ